MTSIEIVASKIDSGDLSEAREADIRDLRDEAREHGDEAMVTICEAALRGDERASAECRRVILATRAEREQPEREAGL